MQKVFPGRSDKNPHIDTYAATDTDTDTDTDRFSHITQSSREHTIYSVRRLSTPNSAGGHATRTPAHGFSCPSLSTCRAPFSQIRKHPPQSKSVNHHGKSACNLLLLASLQPCPDTLVLFCVEQVEDTPVDTLTASVRSSRSCLKAYSFGSFSFPTASTLSSFSCASPRIEALIYTCMQQSTPRCKAVSDDNTATN